jgi:SAM-dependent methyltransferase
MIDQEIPPLKPMTSKIQYQSVVPLRPVTGFRQSLWAIKRFCHSLAPRAFLGYGINPIAVAINGLPGEPIHRYYLEEFIGNHRYDIKGHCLEFQDSFYASRYGDGMITELDIIHLDDSAPEATIVADLTCENGIPGDTFDCIICTHVLEMVTDPERFVAELHRILKPGGILLLAVPHLLYDTNRCGELWRFTPLGLKTLLLKSFKPEHIAIAGYGNSLVAAGDIRGLPARRYSRRELERYDSKFTIEVCARVIKAS